MSCPNIPDITPAIEFNAEEVMDLLLVSIAFEELGLSHNINSEDEKIQYILGTFPGHTPPSQATADDLSKINRAVQKVMRDVIKKQMLLQIKLEEIMNISVA